MLKHALRSSVLYSIAVIAQKLASVLLFPVYTRFLSPADYGGLELLDTLTNIVGIVLAVRIGSALFYYCADLISETADTYLSTAYVSSVLLAVLACGAGWASGCCLSTLMFHNTHWIVQCRLALIGFGLTIPIEVGFAYLRLLNRPVTFVVVSIVRLLLSIAANVYLLTACHLGVSAMLWSTVATGGLFAVYFGWLLFRNRPVRFKVNRFLDLFKYSLPLCATTIAMSVLHSGDRMFLQPYVSLAELGVYAVAYKLGMLIAFGQMPFTLFWAPNVMRIFTMPNSEEIYVRSATYFAVLMIYSTLVLAIFSKVVVEILATPAFYLAERYIPWIACAYALRAMADFAGSIFFVSGKTKLDGLNSCIAACVCIGAYAVLVPPFKLWGAVAATVVGFTTLLVVNIWAAQRIRCFAFEWKRVLHTMACGACLYVLFKLVVMGSAGGQLLWGATLVAAFPVLLCSSGFLKPDEVAYVRNALAGARNQDAALSR